METDVAAYTRSLQEQYLQRDLEELHQLGEHAARAVKAATGIKPFPIYRSKDPTRGGGMAYAKLPDGRVYLSLFAKVFGWSGLYDWAVSEIKSTEQTPV